MFTFIKNLWNSFMKSPEDEYLEKSTDLCDLERRQKNLRYGITHYQQKNKLYCSQRII